MNNASPDLHSVFAMITVPPPDDYERALQRERLDATILRSLGERRAHREMRTNAPSTEWDELERLVTRGATMLWETSASHAASLSDDLLAYCAFLARELALTESMDLTTDEASARLEALAPRAIAALDEIAGDLVTARAESNPIKRALAAAFGALRAHLVEACRIEWQQAA